MTLPGYFKDGWWSLADKLSGDENTIQNNSTLHHSCVTKSTTSSGWSKGSTVWFHVACDFPWQWGDSHKTAISTYFAYLLTFSAVHLSSALLLFVYSTVPCILWSPSASGALKSQAKACSVMLLLAFIMVCPRFSYNTVNNDWLKFLFHLLHFVWFAGWRSGTSTV